MTSKTSLNQAPSQQTSLAPRCGAGPKGCPGKQKASPHWDLLGHTLDAQGMQCPPSLYHAEGRRKVQLHLLPTWRGRTELQLASKAPTEAAPPCMPCHVPQPQGTSWGLSLCCHSHTVTCQQVPLQLPDTKNSREEFLICCPLAQPFPLLHSKI